MKVLALVIAIAAIAVISIGATRPSTEGRPSVQDRTLSVQVRTEKCRSARLAVVHYRAKTWERQRAREGGLATRSPIVQGKTCGWSRYAAAVWSARATAARKSLQRWIAERTLEDVESWQEAIQIVQRFFPGTASWLDSCSDAEGMAPRYDRVFYTYGYRPFSWDAWNSNTVGNPMQMRPGTFIYFYNRGRPIVLDRGYRLPEHLLHADARSWQSMLAAAIAGGYARWSGEDNSHWRASWGRGC